MITNRSLIVWFSLVLSAVIISSCSTSRDRLINREWHKLNTKYNVVFNGNESFNENWNTLQSGYREDFWKLLPIERLDVDQKYVLKFDSDEDSPFAIAEEKAVKAIKKHGMMIEDQEVNAQMIEAYLLLGKARYFDQRFVPAYEAFSYIIKKHPATNRLNKVRIWKERTNIRLGNEVIAIENLKRLMKYRELKDQELADANATMAQAYMNTDSIAQAIDKLTIAVGATRKNVERARYHFILGQLFTSSGNLDKAQNHFQQIVELNRRAPRAFWIHSKLRTLRFAYQNKGDQTEHLSELAEMVKSWQNQEYLDVIHYQQGVVYLEEEMDSLGVAYINKSLRANQNDPTLTAMSYELLADHYFDNNEYVSAHTYYDSLLPYLVNPSEKYRAILKRSLKLADVALYETRVATIDSVLDLANAPKDRQLELIEKHIQTLQLQEDKKEQLQEEEKEAKEKKANEAFSNPSSPTRGSFYFYNPAMIERGQKAFRQQWGDRALADNWRSEQKTKQVKLINQEESTANKQVVEEQKERSSKFDPEFYLSQIPTEEKTLDSLKREKNYAHFRLGTIYKESFELYDLALKNLMISSLYTQSEAICIPSLYAIYKTYELLDDDQKANQVKNKIINSYPESVYAQVLKDPSKALLLSASKFDKQYQKVYQSFKNQKYDSVIKAVNEVLDRTTDIEEAGKWANLKALSVGRSEGFVAYKREMEQLVKDFPSSSAAENAVEFLTKANSAVGTPEFGDPLDSDHWKLAIWVNNKQATNDSIIGQRIRSLFKDDLSHLRYSKESYSPVQDVYVVHGFPTQIETVRFSKNPIFKDPTFENGEFFVILASHYRTVQLYKNLKAYSEEHKALKR